MDIKFAYNEFFYVVQSDGKLPKLFNYWPTADKAAKEMTKGKNTAGTVFIVRYSPSDLEWDGTEVEYYQGRP